MEDSAGGEWARSDAWILEAIMLLDPEGSGSLTDLVARVDAIYRLLPGEKTVRQAVRRLLGASLKSVEQRRFRLTDAGRVMVMAGHRRGRSALKQVDSLEELLRRLPVREQEWSLEPGEMREAHNAWHQRVLQIQTGGRRRRGRPTDP